MSFPRRSSLSFVLLVNSDSSSGSNLRKNQQILYTLETYTRQVEAYTHAGLDPCIKSSLLCFVETPRYLCIIILEMDQITAPSGTSPGNYAMRNKH
jgi:hypothetical protein